MNPQIPNKFSYKYDTIKCSIKVQECPFEIMSADNVLLFSAVTWTRGGIWYRYGTYGITVSRLWAYSSTSAPWIQEQLLPASSRRGWFSSQSRPSTTAAANARSIHTWQSTSQAKVIQFLLSYSQASKT